MTPPRDPNQLPVLDRATGLDDGYDCPECGFAATCADCSDGEGGKRFRHDNSLRIVRKVYRRTIDEGELP